ncbi:hypothetical protein [Anaerobiospirillum succiniciproducens]|uniref:hypothetical protein n=1 Tax=Anaerobiospirillum succiniciproducens TaxID=13335 RepID=UPI00248EA2C0|nr:hypothetical protein [Anaerobiospirillum succiniciproducens]
MKQTNNAIKFLRAQYRAIFKNANIAMVAAMAAAALAAGQAQAAANDGLLDAADFENKSASTAKVETITKKSTFDLKDLAVDKDAFAYAGAASATKIDGAEVSITGATDKHLAFAGLSLVNGAKLTVTNTGAQANSTIYGFKSGTSPKGKGNEGTLTVDGSTIEATSTAFQFNNVEIKNKSTVTIGGKVAPDMKDKAEWWMYSNIGTNVNGTSGGVLKVTDSTVNLKDKSQLVSTTEVLLDRATVNFDGDMNASGFSTAFIRGISGASVKGKVTVKGGTTLNASGTSGNGAIYADVIDLQDATISVAESKKFILDGDWEDSAKANAGKHNKSAITIKNLTTDGKGTLVLGNATSGGTVTVNGATTIGGAVENNADLTVTGAGVLSVGSGSLANNKGLFNSGAGATKSGTVTLAKGGTLHINDTTSSASYDVHGITFADTAGGNKIAIASGEKGTITGDFLTVSANIASATGLTVKANDTLTLGGASFQNAANKIGVAALDAKNVKLVASGSDTKYTLQDKLNLSTADTGKITGTALDVSGGTVAIKAGTYTLDKDLTITSGETTSKVGLSIADGAKLVVSGGKLATVNAANGKIDVAGGILDASKASDYDLKSGTVVLSNAAELHLDDSKVLSGGTALVASKFTGGAVTSDASSKIVFTDVSMTKQQFEKLVTDSKFAGIFDGVTLTGYDVSGKQDISNIQSNFAQGHEDVQAVVSGNSVSANYSVGNAQLKDSGDSLELAAGGNMTLVNANAGDGAGKFVSDMHVTGNYYV